MKALILAGGKGTRLAPFTATIPKPLFPVGEKTILEIVIEQLERTGIRDIVLAVGHLAGLIEAYFGDGSRFGVSISYLREDDPLGTAGSISYMKGEREDFIVMNGDVLADVDFKELRDYHRSSGAAVTICGYSKRTRSSLGVIETDNRGFLRDYLEKPEMTQMVSTGIYCFSPRAALLLREGERLDLPELMMRLVGKGEKVKVYELTNRWYDIGTPEDYGQAVEYWKRAEGKGGVPGGRGR